MHNKIKTKKKNMKGALKQISAFIAFIYTQSRVLKNII